MERWKKILVYIEHPNGSKEWWINRYRHRIDGPAVDYADGSKEWWINGKHITDEVNDWMKENNISYPFNEETLFQFKMRFL